MLAGVFSTKKNTLSATILDISFSEISFNTLDLLSPNTPFWEVYDADLLSSRNLISPLPLFLSLIHFSINNQNCASTFSTSVLSQSVWRSYFKRFLLQVWADGKLCLTCKLCYVQERSGRDQGQESFTAVWIWGAVVSTPGVQQEVNIWVHLVNTVTLGISHPSCWLSWANYTWRVTSTAMGSAGWCKYWRARSMWAPILGEGYGEGGGFAVRIGFGFSAEYKMSLQAKFPLL